MDGSADDEPSAPRSGDHRADPLSIGLLAFFVLLIGIVAALLLIPILA